MSLKRPQSAHSFFTVLPYSKHIFIKKLSQKFPKLLKYRERKKKDFLMEVFPEKPEGNF